MATAVNPPSTDEGPKWKVTAKYRPGVLIGNWSEDRHEFYKGSYKHNSTHREGCRKVEGHRPDVYTRRAALLRSTGLDPKHILYHHGDRYSNNMITWYDEDFNKRPRVGINKLPPQRDWNFNNLAWVPEKSDHPIVGDPTNYGLYDKKCKIWAAEMAESVPSYDTSELYKTTYTASYIPRSCQRPVNPHHTAQTGTLASGNPSSSQSQLADVAS